MLSKEEVTQIAADFLAKKVKQIEVALLTDQTREFELGWVFFWQSRRYMETGRFGDRLGGNAPIIVNKHDGSAVFTGTGYPVEKYIADYLKARQ